MVSECSQALGLIWTGWTAQPGPASDTMPTAGVCLTPSSPSKPPFPPQFRPWTCSQGPFVVPSSPGTARLCSGLGHAHGCAALSAPSSPFCPGLSDPGTVSGSCSHSAPAGFRSGLPSFGEERTPLLHASEHKWLAPLVLLQSGLMLWQTRCWRVENAVFHCVSLLLSVTERTLQSLAELQEAVLQCPVSDPTAKGQSSCCSIVHVVNCEEEFQQQQLDVLWRILDPGKHLVCGPVKVTNPSSPIGADQYFQLRKRQMYEASVIKYGELAQDEAWTEVIDTLTVAAIRFEMLSTAHRSQVGHISTKGTKSGAFVMYNCARLATLFSTFQRAVEQGTYPPLNGGICGEWLLLFNYLLPFPEVLQQAAQLSPPSKGIRITASTETVCKFLIQLSMDFSSYYNRVHILGEPFPHLFDQMFARLQLLGAVRDVFHSALATLHLPPLSQI
uniref:DALR anticodon binding domain containing 3 n=1 Tax=Zonotrichia albicollis TaxID=44394 RepID=A0A8D2M5W6_ZONAL